MKSLPPRSLTEPPRSGSFLLIVLALLTSFGLVFAQGTSPAKPSSTPIAGTPVATDTNGTPKWDSIYAGIQVGFQALRPTFQKGCFDCHTDQTHYPWYHHLPLVRGMIDKDIRVARKRLNMSVGFPFSIHGQPADDLSRIRDELEQHDMPPWEYRLMHWDANPTAAERDSVIAWIDRSLAILAAHGQYPFDQPDEK
jgi:hypothetical protein